MIKEVKYTLIIVIIILVIFSFKLNIIPRTSSLNPPEFESVSYETIAPFYETLTKSNLIRKANFSIPQADDTELVKFLIENMPNEDVGNITVEPVKIVCQVTDSISFYSDTTCQIRIFSNAKIQELQKKYFYDAKSLTFKNFNYNGLECKNNGKNYYCHVTPYQRTYHDYTLISDIHKEDDKIIISEYYLHIVLENSENCNKLLTPEQCTLKTTEFPPLEEEIIKNNGIKYQHEFIAVEDTYKLSKSFIVSD